MRAENDGELSANNDDDDDDDDDVNDVADDFVFSPLTHDVQSYDDVEQAHTVKLPTGLLGRTVPNAAVNLGGLESPEITAETDARP